PQAMRVEHTWVRAYVGDSYRGARGGGQSGWIDLDPSFKQYKYEEPMNPSEALGVDANALIDGIKAQGTSTDDTFQLNNKDYPKQVYDQLAQKVSDYWDAKGGNVTMSDFVGAKRVVEDKSGLFPLSLPYRVVARTAEEDTIADSQRHKVRFTVVNPDPVFEESTLTYTVPVAAFAGKRVSLSYEGATQSDQDLINSRGDIFSVPAYALTLKPVLWIGGKAVAEGQAGGGYSPCRPGSDQVLQIDFISPEGRTDSVHHEITAGQYAAIGFDLGKVTGRAAAQAATTYQANTRALKRQAEGNLPITIGKDDVFGQFLHMMILTYFGQLDNYQIGAARGNGIIRIRDVSEGIAASGVAPTYLFGLPVSVSPDGVGFDIAQDSYAAIPADGNAQSVGKFSHTVGPISSYLESKVPDELFSKTEGYVGSVSTVKLLDIAARQGTPVYKVDTSNINTVLGQLQQSESVTAAIADAVSAGKEVFVPKAAVNLDGWTGSGYMVLDKDTGAGAYMIDGGLSGGKAWWREALDKFAKAVGGGWVRDIIMAVVFLVVAIFSGPVAIALGIAWSILSTLDTWMSIQENDKLSDTTKNMVSAFIIAFLVIGLILAFFTGGLAILVVLFFLGAFMSLCGDFLVMAAEKIEEIMKKKNQQADEALGGE
ncbi:MAG: hypothetical protein IT210_05435, partial [Armatimonadetes bacterium]|nr:hypothetical protein [Armatimonadota bacterium]